MENLLNQMKLDLIADKDGTITATQIQAEYRGSFGNLTLVEVK